MKIAHDKRIIAIRSALVSYLLFSIAISLLLTLCTGGGSNIKPWLYPQAFDAGNWILFLCIALWSAQIGISAGRAKEQRDAYPYY